VSAETKHQSRERRAAIRNVLLKEWDPIGGAGISGAEDEYDSYVGEIYLLLFEERATTEALSAHLLQIAIERMGLRRNAQLSTRCAETARTLVAMRPRLDSH
jgi:hypothetical protein